MCEWIINYLDNWSAMSVPTNFDEWKKKEDKRLAKLRKKK